MGDRDGCPMVCVGVGVVAALGVEGVDFGFDGVGAARDGLEHGVGAESVEVGARVGEGQAVGDGTEGECGVERESKLQSVRLILH